MARFEEASGKSDTKRPKRRLSIIAQALAAQQEAGVNERRQSGGIGDISSEEMEALKLDADRRAAEALRFIEAQHFKAKQESSMQLTQLNEKQATYIGVAKSGPYKPEHYRY